MKRYLAVFISLFLLLTALCGCSEGEPEKKEPVESGVYKMVSTNDEQADYVFTPYLALNNISNLESSFTFYYDPLSSYMPTGTYAIEDNVIICETLDGMYTYTFKIIDDHTVSFVAEQSDAITYYDLNVVGNDPVIDGSVFELVSD